MRSRRASRYSVAWLNSYNFKGDYRECQQVKFEFEFFTRVTRTHVQWTLDFGLGRLTRLARLSCTSFWRQFSGVAELERARGWQLQRECQSTNWPVRRESRKTRRCLKSSSQKEPQISLPPSPKEGTLMPIAWVLGQTVSLKTAIQTKKVVSWPPNPNTEANWGAD